MEIKMPHYKFHSGKTLTEDSKVFKIYKIKDPVCHPYNNHIFCRVYQKYRNFHVLCALVNLYRFILTSKLILACPRICYHFYKVCKLHNDVGKAQPTTSVGVATRTYRFKMNPLFRCATLPNTFHSSKPNIYIMFVRVCQNFFRGYFRNNCETSVDSANHST